MDQTVLSAQSSTPPSPSPNVIISPFPPSLPLHTAVIKADKEELKRLIESKEIDINATYKEDNTTALFQAAKHGNARCVRILLKNNANYDISDNFGNTPLIIAAINDRRRYVFICLFGRVLFVFAYYNIYYFVLLMHPSLFVQSRKLYIISSFISYLSHSHRVCHSC